MKTILCMLCCVLSLTGVAQKRAAIFKLDLKGNPYYLKPADLNIHIRQLIDRTQFVDSAGHLDQERYDAALAGKIDTNVRANMDFAFSLRNLMTGSSYRISIYYKVQLDTIRNPEFYRMRAVYRELKVNSWAFEYNVPAVQACKYDASLHGRTCPKCHKADQVLPILYNFSDESEPGDWPAIQSYQSVEGSTDCDPNWYCRRDRLSF